VPLPLLLPAGLALAFLVLPLVGLLVRAPWSTLPQRLTEPGVLTALRLSLVTATIATAVCVVLGVPLAWILARTEFRGRRLVRALVTVPLVLPPVVGGVALLLVLGRRGLIGHVAGPVVRSHDPVHHHRRGHRRGVRGHAVPRHRGRGGAARGGQPVRGGGGDAGRGRWTTFRRVTLPLVASGLWRPARCCAGPGRSASSAPPSRSPAAIPAAPRPCRSPCTWRSSRTSTPRSC
jgi:molybdate transport system permease protein